MANLRQMVDGRTLEFAASPAAKHVAEHIQDPFGKTKDGMDDLNEARMNYEVQKQKMRMNLAPVEHVVQGIKNMHQLDGPGDGSPLDMSPNSPQNIAGNQPPQPMLDENGMVMGQPNLGQMTAPQGSMNTPNAPGAQIDESTGVPNNMDQTTGKMNSNRPSMAGFQPGVSPGPAQSVRPGKMGTPQPGQAKQSTIAGNPSPKNMPAGWTKPGQGPTNDPATYNKAAAPPKGNRSLPGAKGPGDPKVANRTKKAQANSNGGSGRPIHVEVRADSMMAKPAVSTVARAAASDALRLKSYGTSEGVQKEWDTRGRGRTFVPGSTVRHLGVVKTVQDNDAGGYLNLRTGNDPKTDEWVHSNQVVRAASMKASKVCPKCGHVHAKGMKACNYMKASGTSEGVQKEWEIRKRGHISYDRYGNPIRITIPEDQPSRDDPKDIAKSKDNRPRRKFLEARDFSEGRRKKLAKSGAAMPGGGFPIVNREDLANAKQAIGQGQESRLLPDGTSTNRAKALGAKPIGQAMSARMANLTQ